MRRLRFPLAAVTVAVAMLVASPAFAANPTPHDILGSGSDTTYYMMGNHLDTLYNTSTGCRVIALPGDTQPLDNGCLADTGVEAHTENYAHDRVSEAAPLGSSVGILQLCSQGQNGVANIDFARSSRAPKNPDSCTGLHFVAYARDGISWESFPNETNSPSAGVNSLTVAQLRGIFITCTNTSWSDVGGGSRGIVVWAAQAGSGTRSTFEGFLGGGDSTACIAPAFKDGDPDNGEHVIQENNDDPSSTRRPVTRASRGTRSSTTRSAGTTSTTPRRATSARSRGSLRPTPPSRTGRSPSGATCSTSTAAPPAAGEPARPRPT